MKLTERFKPGVSRKNLLFIAGLAWTVAGGILGGRGLNYVLKSGLHPVIQIVIGVVAGIFFYILLFAKISTKHIKRIHGLSVPYPCAFSFFNLRSYLMMGMMITTGILLRTFDVINKDILYTFYITMGIPLLISASRFYYFRFSHKEIK